MLEDRHDLLLHRRRCCGHDVALAVGFNTPPEFWLYHFRCQGAPELHRPLRRPASETGDGERPMTGQASPPEKRRLVHTIVCAYTQAELPTPWLAIFHRFEKVMRKAGLRTRVRLFPLEALPESFEVLVVPPELREAAEGLQAGARLIVTSRADAGAAANELLAEIERGETLFAERVQPGEPRIVTHRGADIL